ncbi:GOLPH3/VPS74 family protein [Streptomyces peucetius]|uniref:GPP34 family phosphoprotein n=1 Tax=Streptomyces peucetius TaxID=1950 RepID=A0ABY6IDM5_STRPE|nr:GPP34 family phosphoprotein [Streptomyces peucetius]UYQ63947.1 GPP34 family phosphoprotein [Streptomyces peucetius]
MAVTLGEEIMLLSLDDESGAAKDRQSAGWAVAGGILLDLVLAGRVSVSDGRVRVTDQAPTGVALLDGRLEQLAAWAAQRSKPRKVTDWLTKDHSKAVGATIDSLRERGLVAEEQHRVLGLFPVRRYPEADGAAERELRERLASVVLHDAAPDDRTAGLVALIHSAKLHRLAFPDLPRKQVAPRMTAIADGQWAGESVREAIRNMQAAMVAVTVATTVAATG